PREEVFGPRVELEEERARGPREVEERHRPARLARVVASRAQPAREAQHRRDLPRLLAKRHPGRKARRLGRDPPPRARPRAAPAPVVARAPRELNPLSPSPGGRGLPLARILG